MPEIKAASMPLSFAKLMRPLTTSSPGSNLIAIFSSSDEASSILTLYHRRDQGERIFVLPEHLPAGRQVAQAKNERVCVLRNIPRVLLLGHRENGGRSGSNRWSSRTLFPKNIREQIP